MNYWFKLAEIVKVAKLPNLLAYNLAGLVTRNMSLKRVIHLK